MVPRSLFKNYGEGATQRRLPNAQQMQQATTEYLKEMTKDTVFFQENPARPVAMFASSELIFGKAIGMGEFGTVVQVEGTRLSQEKQLSDCPASNLEQQSPSQSLSTSPQTDSTHRISKSCADLSLLGELDVLESFNCKEEDFQHQKGLRSRIASNVITANQSSKLYKYAVKQIRKDLYPAKRVEAAKGLAREQKFLASIAHPNIVRLRGIVSKPGFETNMMVLDKLEQSLLQQAVDWKTQSAQLSSFVFPWQSQQRVQVGKDILAGRLLALYDIAQAVKYLHSKSILFRDLKVENVAKNPRSGAMQLFDFGLAKELKAKDKIGNDQYRLTGLTGTLRVMSPEVIQCVPYGSSADIYSFAIVAWEVFTGERNQLSAQDACKGLRPDCHGIQSSIETSLLQPCWRERPDLRPNATQICNLLAADLLALHQPNQDNIIHRVELLREISNENISELANS